MATPATRISDLIVRIQDELLEADAPLTVGELQHLVNTDGLACRAVLGALVDAGVLLRIEDLYMRAFNPAHPPSRRQAA